MGNDYHADTKHVGSTMLKTYLDDGPVIYDRFYVSRLAERSKETEAMQRGSLLHTFALEPDTFNACYLIAPDCPKRSNADKAKHADAAEEAIATRRMLVPRKLVDEARIMADAIRRSDAAQYYLAADQIEAVEEAIYWDEEVGDCFLPCKCKPDLVVYDLAWPRKVIPDLKSSREPGIGFARQAATLFYHVQAAHYLSGYWHAHKLHCDWVWIVVRNEPPWDVHVYRAPDETIRAGEIVRRRAVAELAERYARDDWSEPGMTAPVDLFLPTWAIPSPAA